MRNNTSSYYLPQFIALTKLHITIILVLIIISLSGCSDNTDEESINQNELSHLRNNDAWKRFTKEYGKAWKISWNQYTHTPHRISGHYIPIKETVTEQTIDTVALNFIKQQRQLLKVDPDALVLSKVDWDASPKKKHKDQGSAYVYFVQRYKKLPVVGGSVRLVFKGQKLISMASDFHPGINIKIDPKISKETASSLANQIIPLKKQLKPDAIELVVLPYIKKRKLEYFLSWQVTLPQIRLPRKYVVENLAGVSDRHQRSEKTKLQKWRESLDVIVPVQWRLYIDAKNGTILKQENLVYSENLDGTVTGMMRPYNPSDTPVEVPVSNITINVNQSGTPTSTQTNETGGYLYDNLTAGSLDITAHLKGPDVYVYNGETPDPDATHTVNITAPGTHSWNWQNDDPSPEDVETNAYYHVKKIREWFRQGVPFDITPPPSPTAAENNLEVYVRSGEGCSAYAGGGHIHFHSGITSACPDFALCSGVAYHEYGHLVISKIYNDAGMYLTSYDNGGAMHEGISDYFSATVTNQSATFGECDNRDIGQDTVYPSDYRANNVHWSGTIIGGAVWDVRTALGNTYVDSLAIRALKHAPTSFSEYLAAFLEEDDDPLYSPDPAANNSMSDGSPNIDIICNIFFEQHGIYHDYCTNHTQNPIAIILSPSPVDDLQNIYDSSVPTIDIIGSVQGSSGAGLQSFDIEYADEKDLTTWSSNNITLTGGGAIPVASSSMAQWNISGLADGYYLVRLTVTDIANNTAHAYFGMYIENSIKTGWPQQSSKYFISSPAIADLDPDYPGLEIIARERYGNIYVWHADGSPVSGWPRHVDYPPSSPTVADLDSDGTLEVIAASEEQVFVFNHDGSDVPGWPQACATTIPNRDVSPAAADLNGDGTREIVLATKEGNVCAWHADGTAVSGWPISVGAGVTKSVALADVDNNGTTEVILGTTDGNLYVIDHTGNTLTGWPQSNNIAAAPVITDLDADDDAEIITKDGSSIYAWHHDGTIVTGWPQSVTTGYSSTNHMMVADLDQDGTPEIFVKDYYWAHAFNANGTALTGFPTNFSCPFSCGGGYFLMAAGDMNGDNDVEAVLPFYFWHLGNSWDEYDNLGGHTVHKIFAANQDSSVLSGWPKYILSKSAPSSPVLADIDLDGHVELIAGAAYGMYVWDISGSGNNMSLEWPQNRFDPARTAYKNELADLVIQSHTLDPANPLTTDMITMNVVVLNQGAGPAGSSTLAFKVGGETYPQTDPIPALAPGQSHTIQRQIQLGVAQNYLNTVTADVNSDVTESDETNNVQTYRYQVLPPSGNPADLKIDSHTLTPTNPTTQDQITFTVVVSNGGTGLAVPSTLAFKVGGETYPQTYPVPALAPGQTHTIQRQIQLSTAQNYINTVTIDTTNTNAESDESNNTQRFYYTITPP